MPSMMASFLPSSGGWPVTSASSMNLERLEFCRGKFPGLSNRIYQFHQTACADSLFGFFMLLHYLSTRSAPLQGVPVSVIIRVATCECANSNKDSQPNSYSMGSASGLKANGGRRMQNTRTLRTACCDGPGGEVGQCRSLTSHGEAGQTKTV